MSNSIFHDRLTLEAAAKKWRLSAAGRVAERLKAPVLKDGTPAGFSEVLDALPALFLPSLSAASSDPRLTISSPESPCPCLLCAGARVEAAVRFADLERIQRKAGACRAGARHRVLMASPPSPQAVSAKGFARLAQEVSE